MKEVIGKIKCLFGYHDFKFKERLSEQSMRVICKRCSADMAVNMDMQCAIPYYKIKSFYEIMKEIRKTTTLPLDNEEMNKEMER